MPRIFGVIYGAGFLLMALAIGLLLLMMRISPSITTAGHIVFVFTILLPYLLAGLFRAIVQGRITYPDQVNVFFDLFRCLVTGLFFAGVAWLLFGIGASTLIKVSGELILIQMLPDAKAAMMLSGFAGVVGYFLLLLHWVPGVDLIE
ncbi:hypothetical protein KBC79_06640 [Candidatus Woesebacteria bacterium]|nr:hypothetical protein [Candidatus Woesebacteria bacterium]